MHQLIETLNEAQRNAVMATEGPALVIAGAGSGKTRVLTLRIAHLLQKGVKPWRILSLTFTNKAAREMKERIATVVGQEKASQLWMGTFHSIFARILRLEAAKLGYPQSFTIYDTQDSKNLLKSIIKNMKLSDKEYKTGDVLSAISSAKNDLVTPAAYARDTNRIANDRASRRTLIYEIYAKYMQECYKSGVMDFDDLLLNTNILFRDHPDVLLKYQNHFDYILVDEYQDTNFSQYLIVKKLAEGHKNVCVVGDDAQSIYSFRGAKIENILNFRNDYPGYHLFKLEQNYRSTQTIVEAANSIIAKNEGQIQKNVFSKNDQGEKIRVIKAHSDLEEALIVTNDIAQRKAMEQYEYKDFAILYRTNAQSRTFEEALRKRNQPYKIYGGLAFYQRKEIKDLISYFRVTVNPNDRESLKRIINFPARGIGNTTLEKLEAFSDASGRSIWEVMTNPLIAQSGMNAGTLKKLNGFIGLIAGFHAQMETLNGYEFAAEVVSKSGLMREFTDDKSIEGQGRLENINELLSGIKEFTESRQEQGLPTTITSFLEEVSLLTDMDNEKPEDQNRVTLMTIHASKGLEFKNVYIVGVEEELFPSGRSLNDPKAMEEERRLFYVALTRAEHHATISYTRSRFKFGEQTFCRPSRFISELDSAFIEIKESDKSEINKENRTRPTGFSSSSPASRMGAQKPMIKLNPQGSLEKKPPVSLNYGSSETALTVGCRVMHDRFGIGEVLAFEGNMPDTKVTILFQNTGKKQLLMKFAKLKVLK
ncbi:MAG: ATP-dependent helicase [Breznakibacter sp.]